MHGLKINLYSMIMTVIIVLYSVSAEARVFDNIVVTPSLFERDLASYMLAFIIITTFILFYFVAKLDSQSGKGYAVSKFAKRHKDKKQATKKRAIAAREIEHLKNEDERCKKNKLHSQVGVKDIYNLGFEASEEFKDMLGRIWFFIRGIMEEFQIPSIPWDLLSDWQKVFEENLPRIVNSEILKGINTVLSLFVAIGWVKKIEFSLWGVCIFKTQAMYRTVTMTEVTTEAWKLSKKFLSCIVQFFETGKFSAFWDDVPKSAFEDMYTRIISEWPLIEVGSTGTIEFHDFDRQLDDCVQHCLVELRTCKDGERAYFSSRLLALRKVAVGRCKQKKGGIREGPFSYVITGKSSKGKTCIANALGRYVAGVGGYDNSPDNCYTMNEQDKFMSGIATHHTVIFIDDIAQVKSEKATECPLEKIILLINNQPTPATVAEAEKKGQILLDPRVVSATTNVDDLDAHNWVNEPEAILRRFNVHIEQDVKKEYQEDDSERLDTQKIRHMANDLFPDYAIFRPYVWVPENKGGSTKMDKKIRQSFKKKYFFGDDEWIDIKTLLKFMKGKALDHYEGQRAFVAGQRANAEFNICEECHMPEQLCECTKLDSQAGLPGVSEVRDWYLAMEERVCSQVDTWLVEFFNTRTGYLLLGFNYREQIFEAAWHYATHFFIVLGMAVFSELTGAMYCGTLIFASFVVLCALIYFKVMQLRREMMRRWTHCPRPSVWISQLSWETKRKILFAFGGMFAWKILRRAAAAYFLSLKIKQGGEQDATNNGFQVNEKQWQKDEHPWWGDLGRLFKEKVHKFHVPRGYDAATTSDDHIIKMMMKRQCVLEKDDGEFCNIVPMESNIWVLPGHVIPEEPMKAIIRRPAGNTASVLLDPAATVKVTGDLYLWYLPEMGDQKNLTGFLPTAAVKNEKQLDCRMVYSDGYNVKLSDKFLSTYGRVRTSGGGSFKGINYNFPIDTFNGLCMGTIVGLGKKHHIAGFHLGGRGREGGAGLLIAEQYFAAKEKLNTRPSVLFSHSSTPFETQIQDVNVGPLKAPHEKCVTKSLAPGSKIKILGSHTLSASSPSSAVVTSLISTAVASIMKIERKHDKPRDMAAARHKEIDIAGKVDTVFEVKQARLDMAFVDYSSSIVGELPEKELKQVRVISNDANLSGLDGVLGVNAINFASSRGFPHKGPKTTIVNLSDRVVEGISCVRDAPIEIWEEVAALEEKLAAGERINTVFKGSLKDEPTVMTKDKVRVFAACNFAMILLVRKYFLSLAALTQRNQKIFECAVGVVQQSPEWTDIFEHIGKYGWERGIAGDYAKFDARMSSRFMLAAFKLLIIVAEKSGNYSDRDLTIMRGIATEITYPTYDYFGTLVQFFGSNPSGHPLTVIINSIVNSLYMRYAYYTIAEEDGWWKTPMFREVVSLMTYGDDNIMSVQKGYGAINHTRIASVFADMGIKYTMAEKEAESIPYIHLSTASFLKHFAVWDDELGLYRCPCEEGSIAKMLHSHMKSDVLTSEQSSAEAITNAGLKYFEFGREVYAEKREQLMAVAREAGISGYIRDLPTYDERLDWYREKFELLK